MTVAVIVQARLGSTRLPAKVLLPLPTGRTVIEEVIYLCKQINGVDVVVVAIPDTAENDIVAEHVKDLADIYILPTNNPTHKVKFSVGCPRDGKGVIVMRGPEHDVLARYAKAAELVDASVIMRITADCPLIDPEVCAKVLREVTEGGADYASNVERRSYPQGFDCQVVTRYMLDWANEHATEAYDREHVLTIIERLAGPGFRKVNVSASPDRSHIRWTLDTLEDYVRIWSEFKRREEAA